MPHGDRSNVVIEPFLTDQWYVNAKKLAKPAIAAVRDGKTNFVPKNWEKTYFNWMENIQPWCISRQLWWGHQNSGVVWAELIKAKSLTTSPEHYFVARLKKRPSKLAEAHYKTPVVVLEMARKSSMDRKIRRASRWKSSDHARRGRARHLVLLGAVAVLDAGLAGRDAGAEALLSDLGAGHRLRHHLLLGRAHDDDGPAFHEGSAVPRRLHPPPGARRLRRQDVEVEGQRRRSARRHRRIRRRRAALHAGAQRRRRATTSGSGRRTSRTTAISRPSCGTPRASPR